MTVRPMKYVESDVCGITYITTCIHYTDIILWRKRGQRKGIYLHLKAIASKLIRLTVIYKTPLNVFVVEKKKPSLNSLIGRIFFILVLRYLN